MPGATTTATATSTCSSRATSSSTCEHLPEFGKGKSCEYRGVAVQCGPRGLPGEGDLLFRNEGSGKFVEVGQAAGVSDPRGHYGLGAAWFDFNGDGWPDLYVANDSNANFLYLNQKDGTFKEVGFAAGVAVSEDGAEQGSMGVAVGDYDNSGRLSLFVTNFSEEYNALYHNEGTYFTDRSFRSKTAASSLPYVGWGTELFDYDNDGLLDILVANGHVYPQLDQARLGASAPYRQRRLLYHNNGDGTFEEVSAKYGDVLLEPRVSRGLAMTDLDDDGRVDLVLNDLDGSPQLLQERARAGRPLAVGQARGQRAEQERDRRRRVRQGRHALDAAAGAERLELHLAGRQAPALRPRAERQGRLGRGSVAGPDEDARRERRGRPGAEGQAAVTAAFTPR